MAQWEYHMAVRRFDAEKGRPWVQVLGGDSYSDEVSMLDDMGENGWELAGVSSDVGSDWNFAVKAYQVTTMTMFFFKRPL